MQREYTASRSLIIEDKWKGRRRKDSYATIAGHMMADCPDFKKKMISSLKQKRPVEKKVYKSTWDSESEAEDEVDTANMCFMANTPKVTTQPLDDENEISREMLEHGFVELSESFDDKKVECSKLKKKIEMLKNQLAISSKEKDELSSNLISTKRA